MALAILPIDGMALPESSLDALQDVRQRGADVFVAAIVVGVVEDVGETRRFAWQRTVGHSGRGAMG